MGSIDPRTALRVLLGESVAEREFLARFWGRFPHVARSAVDEFGALYSAERFWGLSHVGEIDAARRAEGDQQQQFRIVPEKVSELFGSGFTVCADVSSDPRLEPLLRGIKSRLSLLGGPSFARVYASPAGEGFALHTDPHHVFVVQLAGKKRWRYSRQPVVESPLDGMRIHESTVIFTGGRDGEPVRDDAGKLVPVPNTVEFEETILEPGDRLYLPPGFWHRADAIGDSVALSVSPPRAPAAQVLGDLVYRVLQESPSGRADVVSIGEDLSNVEKQLRSCLAQWNTSAEVSEPYRLVRAWSDAVARERGAPELDAHQVVDVRKTDRLCRIDPNPMLVCVDPTHDAVRFFQGGAEWTFPIEARAFVEQLAQRTEYVAREALRWDRRLDWDAAKAVWDQLAAAGIVKVVDRISESDSGAGGAGFAPDAEEDRAPEG